MAQPGECSERSAEMNDELMCSARPVLAFRQDGFMWAFLDGAEFFDLEALCGQCLKLYAKVDGQGVGR